MAEPVVADEARVRKISRAMLKGFTKLLARGELPYIDIFMGAHNAHREMVLEIVEQMPVEQRYVILTAAKETWSRAMDEAIARIAAGEPEEPSELPEKEA